MKTSPEGKPVGKPYRDYLGRARQIVELPQQELPVRKVLRQHTHTVTLPPSPPITYEHVHAVNIAAPEHIHGSKEDRNGAA